MSVQIAVVGAGLVGSRHIESIGACSSASLACIVEPSSNGYALAAELSVPHFDTLDQMIKTSAPDGVILATPNELHVEMALACLQAGIPTLVEKPLATDLSGAQQIVDASKDSGVPVLTGHHRRHNPLIAKAKNIIQDGQLGSITTVQATTWFHKHDDYFNVEWRTKPGAGPIYINLIHDIDLLRYLCGDIASVHAVESNRIRGYEVEDTAVILLTFQGGALGTISVSDTTVAPWSWELTAKENPVYPATDQICYQIGGTAASLSLPNLSLWTHPHERSWWSPISETKIPVDSQDPLVRQVEHLVQVIRKEAQPVVTALDGYKNQAVLEAIKQSAVDGKTIHL
ncbi:MAG: Gfo/Idh/MocA family oxidoreductase [Gammaproteobacteria bacterium]|nr:Gfo/Idh/MocA family oxidoreductase [Gammaproteobacteria bacterium]